MERSQKCTAQHPLGEEMDPFGIPLFPAKGMKTPLWYLDFHNCNFHIIVTNLSQLAVYCRKTSKMF